MIRRPPGLFAVVRLLTSLSLRRTWHRLGSLGRSRRRGPGRAPVGRKSGGMSAAVVVIGLLLVVQSFGMSWTVLTTYATGVEEDAWANGEVPDARGPALDDAGEGRAPDVHLGTSPVDPTTWPQAAREGRLLRALAALFGMLFGAIFALNVASGRRDLGEAGWDMEWLFTFPVPGQGLFLARLGAYAFSDVWTWIVFTPLLVVVLWTAGHAGWGIPLALLATLALALAQGALRIAAETWLRLRLGRGQIKNVQATATILSMVGLFGAFVLAMHPPEALFAFARGVPGPAAAAFLGLPWATPLLAATSGAAVLLPLAWAALLSLLSIRLCVGFVRDGVVATGGGPYEGRRGDAAARARPRRRLAGIAGKEVRLLLRDRNLLVQMLVVPLVVLAFNLAINPSLQGLDWSAGHVVLVAYGVGAYTLMFGAFSILAVERSSLWLLFTLPQRLGTLLRRKVVLWGLVATAYYAGVLAFAWRPPGPATLGDVLRLVLAGAGLWALAYLAGSLGALGTDPFAQEQRHRLKPAWVYLFLAVASAQGLALSREAAWIPLAAVVLVATLAWALWRKAGRSLPLLLDPVARP